MVRDRETLDPRGVDLELGMGSKETLDRRKRPGTIAVEHPEHIDHPVLDEDEAPRCNEWSVGLQLLADMGRRVIAVEDHHHRAGDAGDRGANLHQHRVIDGAALDERDPRMSDLVPLLHVHRYHVARPAHQVEEVRIEERGAAPKAP